MTLVKNADWRSAQDCAKDLEDAQVMATRREFVLAAGALLIAGLDVARAQAAPEVLVFKNPACGCCGDWMKHMRANGFRVEARDVADVAPIRRRHAVPEALASCHTALIGGYVIEGHVPAADVRRLLRERLAIKGLSVPGMVIGSPGMEQGKPQPYATIAFDERGTWVFARH